MKIERLLGILFYILNRDRVSATRLAKEFNVSRRTIIRDIDTLSLAGVPIYAEVGVNGGYAINPDYQVSNKIIDQTNADYLLLALESLKSVYGTKKVNDTYEKIKAVYALPDDQTLLEIDFSVVNENSSVIENIALLKNAVQEKKAVSFDYINLKKEKSHVTIDALHVFYKWYAWYLLGYNQEKQECRMYKIIRLRNLNVQSEQWQNDYDVADLMQKHVEQQHTDVQSIIIEYQKESQILIEEYFQGETLNESPTTRTIELKMRENNFMLFSLLLGFGDQIKVLAPASFAEKIKTHLEATLQNNYPNSDR
ncbi:helix-turn-helix transcriptional regulator [Enterococcus ureasiticus]|uniref:Transcriptional regulator n=1 Tax=Enterococcus ureasiticus TaxID=903984 RepID=A0A1E5GB30_9ENTE|nr:YafY family protein [Enterococcus ureasiticus]OEG09470.1 transcriptional regulator [Enterococcus ureasiticus]